VAQAFPKTRYGRLFPQQYVEGILIGDRGVLARATTVIESALSADADLVGEILAGVLPATGKARRIGITGVLGAGKSTFIDALGVHLIHDRQEKLAVLSIDPSSPLSGGSILGDKTRMERLSVKHNASIPRTGTPWRRSAAHTGDNAAVRSGWLRQYFRGDGSRWTIRNSGSFDD
jgi:putative protein kinase ArgK-like GTPase of G3E family